MKRGVAVAFLLLASAYCLLGVMAVADLAPAGDPTASRRAYAWLAAAIALGLTGLWQLVLLIKQRRRGHAG